MGPSSVDIASFYNRAMRHLQADSLRSTPKPELARIEDWRSRVNYIRNKTVNNKTWQRATTLLAKLELVSEGLWAVDTSALEEEIDALLGGFEKYVNTEPPLRDELVEVCARADQHISAAKELTSRFEGAAGAEIENRKLSSDVWELVREISGRIDKATSEARDQLERLADSDQSTP